ncbi:hypothetical protein SCHPADRAFT_891811 [Schizopora paradoxa]|uniref:Uncharacterized protein n=1 Tax=Schizopora paradoxa TaxID=27342 RepID=A0A0H2RHT5_9AGAM|nr:hypothetical protein SCHPADRAFT_891811 [Schizopora paradoxa]
MAKKSRNRKTLARAILAGKENSAVLALHLRSASTVQRMTLFARMESLRLTSDLQELSFLAYDGVETSFKEIQDDPAAKDTTEKIIVPMESCLPDAISISWKRHSQSLPYDIRDLNVRDFILDHEFRRALAAVLSHITFTTEEFALKRTVSKDWLKNGVFNYSKRVDYEGFNTKVAAHVVISTGISYSLGSLEYLDRVLSVRVVIILEVVGSESQVYQIVKPDPSTGGSSHSLPMQSYQHTDEQSDGNHGARTVVVLRAPTEYRQGSSVGIYGSCIDIHQRNVGITQSQGVSLWQVSSADERTLKDEGDVVTEYDHGSVGDGAMRANGPSDGLAISTGIRPDVVHQSETSGEYSRKKNEEWSKYANFGLDRFSGSDSGIATN